MHRLYAINDSRTSFNHLFYNLQHRKLPFFTFQNLNFLLSVLVDAVFIRFFFNNSVCVYIFGQNFSKILRKKSFNGLCCLYFFNVLSKQNMQLHRLVILHNSFDEKWQSKYKFLVTHPFRLNDSNTSRYLEQILSRERHIESYIINFHYIMCKYVKLYHNLILTCRIWYAFKNTKIIYFSFVKHESFMIWLSKSGKAKPQYLSILQNASTFSQLQYSWFGVGSIRFTLNYIYTRFTRFSSRVGWGLFFLHTSSQYTCVKSQVYKSGTTLKSLL